MLQSVRVSASKRTCDLVSGFVHVRECSHVLVVGGGLRETYFFFCVVCDPSCAGHGGRKSTLVFGVLVVIVLRSAL